MRPKFGSRPSAVALVMKSSDPASTATMAIRAGRSAGARSIAMSSGCASSSAGVPRPRTASGAAMDPRRDRHEEQRPDRLSRRPQMRAQHPDEHEERGRDHQRERAVDDVRHRLGLEHQRERLQVGPHQRRARQRGGGAEPREHADAHPRRREDFAREQLPHHQDDVEDHRQVDGVEQSHGGHDRHEPERVKRQRRVELQDERHHVAARQHRGDNRVAEHSKIAHGTHEDTKRRNTTAEDTRSTRDSNFFVRSSGSLSVWRLRWFFVRYTAAMPIDVAAEVIANRRLSSDYNVLALAAPAIAAAASPGQFVMIKAGRGRDPLLRRPFSVFEVLRGPDAAPTGISLLNKRIGISTGLVYAAQPGDRVDCLGPLGRSFSIVEPPTEAWMVAGGVGLAPFAALAEALRRRGVASVLFYGARRAAELFYLEFFRDLGVELVLTTEDGSLGERGRIVAPLERRLSSQPADRPVMVYACGPEGMLAATAKTARAPRPSLSGVGGAHHGLRPRRLLQLRGADALR